uniref:Uncharacterized protein n=1 Tax=Lepeophtheirus salmonis TaxID=72036 RepID=A0A0K2TSX3_LEPSM
MRVLPKIPPPNLLPIITPPEKTFFSDGFETEETIFEGFVNSINLSNLKDSLFNSLNLVFSLLIVCLSTAPPFRLLT